MQQLAPQYFDIHSHLDFDAFDVDREQVIAALETDHIWTCTVGVDAASSKRAVALADIHPHLFASIGLHPADNTAEVFNENIFSEMASHKKVVAVGECGLDYARLPSGDEEREKTRQKNEFEKQIHFAVAHNKPLMIHCRDAYPDTLALLASKKKELGDTLRGNFHFFTSPIDTAKACLELGFKLSFTGPVTFVPAYEEVVVYVPLEHMMVETDSPFAAPAPHRGKRNSPGNIHYIVRKIAEVKKMDFEVVRQTLVDNALDFFGIILT